MNSDGVTEKKKRRTKNKEKKKPALASVEGGAWKGGSRNVWVPQLNQLLDIGKGEEKQKEMGRSAIRFNANKGRRRDKNKRFSEGRLGLDSIGGTTGGKKVAPKSRVKGKKEGLEEQWVGGGTASHGNKRTS